MFNFFMMLDPLYWMLILPALALRTAVVPAVSIGSNLAIPIIILGAILHWFALAKIGIILFAGLVLFQLVTLPVEFNASSRAREALQTAGIVQTPDEIEGVRSVLGAAAMTYVAATISAVATLLYFLIRLGFLHGRDE